MLVLKMDQGRPGVTIGPTADLTVFNRSIVTFRQPFLGIGPRNGRASRASASSRCSRAAARARWTSTHPARPTHSVDGEYVFVITPEDAATGAGISLDVTALGAAASLTRVIEETKEARDAKRMLRSGAISAVATVDLLLVLWILVRVGRVLTRRMARLANATTEKLRIGGTELVQRQRALAIARAVTRVGRWFLILLATYEWLGFVLSQFPFTRPWGEHPQPVPVRHHHRLPGRDRRCNAGHRRRPRDLRTRALGRSRAAWVLRRRQSRAHRGRLGRPRHRAAIAPPRHDRRLDLRAHHGLPVPSRQRERGVQGGRCDRPHGLARPRAPSRSSRAGSC